MLRRGGVRPQPVGCGVRSALRRNPATPGEVRDAASGDEGGSETLVRAGQIGEERTVAVSDTRVSRAIALRAASPDRGSFSASAGRKASGLRSAQARRCCGDRRRSASRSSGGVLCYTCRCFSISSKQASSTSGSWSFPRLRNSRTVLLADFLTASRIACCRLSGSFSHSLRSS